MNRIEMQSKTMEEVYNHFLQLTDDKERHFLMEDAALNLTRYNDILFQDAMEIVNVYFLGYEPHRVVERILNHDMRGALLDQGTARDFHALYRVMENVFPADVMASANAVKGYIKERRKMYEGTLAEQL